MSNAISTMAVMVSASGPQKMHIAPRMTSSAVQMVT